jgi:uncharacterized membrane protein
MRILIVGLALFLGTHLVRTFAGSWRLQQIERHGVAAWRTLHAVVSAIGFVLIVWGYDMTRYDAIEVWDPPAWTRPAAAALLVPAFVLFGAAGAPRNRLKAALGHPFLIGVELWAIAHLLANGRAGDIVLFGTFLTWAALEFRAARARDRREGAILEEGTLRGDAAAVILGLIAWWVFAWHLHGLLIGVRPIG